MKIKISKKQWKSIGEEGKKAGWKISQMYSRFETLDIGPTPSGEDCVQVGSDQYRELNPMEIKAFANQCTRMFPNIPPGARYVRTSNPHDFGTYHELGIKYQEDDEAAMSYAFNVENNAPEYWDDQAKSELSPQGYFDKLGGVIQNKPETIETIEEPAIDETDQLISDYLNSSTHLKIAKTAGKHKLTISKKQWESIGKKAGWMKKSQIPN